MLVRRSMNMWISNPSITHTCQANDHSTGNLNCHVCECEPVEMPESKAMENFVAGFTYTHEGFRFQIAKWIIKHCCPFAIIQDEELVEAFQMLHAAVSVPSQFSVGWDIRAMFSVMKAHVIAIFEVRIYIGLYQWFGLTNPQWPRLTKMWFTLA